MENSITIEVPYYEDIDFSRGSDDLISKLSIICNWLEIHISLQGGKFTVTSTTKILTRSPADISIYNTTDALKPIGNIVFLPDEIVIKDLLINQNNEVSIPVISNALLKD